jgi:hypothetical protein
VFRVVSNEERGPATSRFYPELFTPQRIERRFKTHHRSAEQSEEGRGPHRRGVIVRITTVIALLNRHESFPRADSYREDELSRFIDNMALPVFQAGGARRETHIRQ